MKAPDRRGLVSRVIQVGLVDGGLALEDRIHALSGHVAMLFAVEQGGSVLAVKDDHVDRVARVSTGVDDHRLGDSVAVGEVASEEFDEKLFVDFAFVALVANAVRGTEVRFQTGLFAGKGLLKEDDSLIIRVLCRFDCCNHLV